MEEKLLTQSQAAEFLGVSEQDLEKMVKEGRIHAYKIGGVFIRFQKRQLEALKNELSLNKKIKKSSSDFLNTKNSEYKYSFGEKFKDFVYFNDFYIIAAIIILIFLIYILVTIY